ncbi:MAG: ATP-binding protein [candidate division KSB1 bacterium]|nr:ATP-binding protein [candidate division KSB1 bacterium]
MRLSLRKKIILLIISLLCISIFISSIISSFEIQKYYKARIFEQLSTQLHELDFILSERLHDFSSDSTYTFFTRYAKKSNKRLTLIDSVGTVIFDSQVPLDSLPYIENHINRPEIREARQFKRGQDERTSATIHQFMYYAAKIYSHSGSSNNIHYLRLAIPMEDIQKVLETVRWKIMAAGGMALIVVVIISYITASHLTYPIHKLSVVAEKIKQGDWNARFHHEGNDELAELAELLNEMMDKLRQDLIEMKKLQKMRSDFLGNVSHELRTPIFTVQGYLETLMQNPNAPRKQQKKFIKKAYRQADRLNNLLSDLIDISRIESGEMKMTMDHFDVHNWLKKHAYGLREVAEENNIKIVMSNSHNDHIRIYGDINRLNQVIQNLVQNAIKYNVPGGKVELGYTVKNNIVEIYVSDTGNGIEQQHLSRIFERFYRVDKERSREVGGTGLGLAIVKHILEAHNSRIHVQSTIGQGSRFSFELPKAPSF